MKKLFIMISLGVLAHSGNVFADEDNATAFHGSGCESYFAGDKAKFNNQWNGISNVSGSGAWVSCPIDKDAVASLGGLGYTWVHGQTPAGTTISCTAVSLGYDANWSESQFGSGGTGWFAVPPLVSDNYWGSAMMYCFLPAGATLNNFVIHEN